MILHQERGKQEEGVIPPKFRYLSPFKPRGERYTCQGHPQTPPLNKGQFSLCPFCSAGCGDGSDCPRLKQLGDKLVPSLAVPSNSTLWTARSAGYSYTFFIPGKEIQERKFHRFPGKMEIFAQIRNPGYDCTLQYTFLFILSNNLRKDLNLHKRPCL